MPVGTTDLMTSLRGARPDRRHIERRLATESTLSIMRSNLDNNPLISTKSDSYMRGFELAVPVVRGTYVCLVMDIYARRGVLYECMPIQHFNFFACPRCTAQERETGGDAGIRSETFNRDTPSKFAPSIVLS